MFSGVFRSLQAAGLQTLILNIFLICSEVMKILMYYNLWRSGELEGEILQTERTLYKMHGL